MGEIIAKQSVLKTGEIVLLRTAVPEDTERVYELARSVMEESEFVVTTPEEMSLTIEQERNWIQSHLEDPGKLMVVAEFFGAVI